MMIFTDEELERELSSFINPKLKNQDLVKKIHLMFGGEYVKSSVYWHNHVMFKVNGESMFFVYDSREKEFRYKLPNGFTENVNGWKLKKLIKSITGVFKEEKERTLRIKLSRIEGDF